MSKHINDLEKKLTAAFLQIKEGKVKPADSKVGMFLKLLKEVDEASYEKFFEAYKPIFAAYKEKEANVQKQIKKATAEVENMVLTSEDVLMNEDDEIAVKEPKVKVVKEKPVTKVTAPKVQKSETATGTEKSVERDKTKYEFNGTLYGKGPLVHAVIKDYVTVNKNLTFEQLAKAFPKENMQPKFGVVALVKEAKEHSVKFKRFFLNDDQILKTQKDKKEFAVCKEFGIGNIHKFTDCCKTLGIKIKEVNG